MRQHLASVERAVGFTIEQPAIGPSCGSGADRTRYRRVLVSWGLGRPSFPRYISHLGFRLVEKLPNTNPLPLVFLWPWRCWALSCWWSPFPLWIIKNGEIETQAPRLHDCDISGMQCSQMSSLLTGRILHCQVASSGESPASWPGKNS